MRYLFLAILTIALFAVLTADASAGLFGRRTSGCANGQCSAPPSVSVLKPTAAVCDCATTGVCKCSPASCQCPNCKTHGHTSSAACEGNSRSGFMSRGPIRRGVRGVFGRLFGCRGC